MIYTDGVHLISDVGVEELTKYGEKVGLKLKWIQFSKQSKFIHFDIFGEIKKKVMRDKKVKKVQGKRLVEILRETQLKKEILK